MKRGGGTKKKERKGKEWELRGKREANEGGGVEKEERKDRKRNEVGKVGV